MSSNSQGRDHFWQQTPNHMDYYQAPPNYYVSRNTSVPHTYNGQSWFDDIDDHVNVTAEDLFPPFIVSTNSQSHHTYKGQSSFDHIEDPCLWDDVHNQTTGEFVDGVYVTTESELVDGSGFIDDDYDTTESGSIDYIHDFARTIYWSQNSDADMVEDSDEEEETTEETIATMMKTRTHCGTDDGGELCVICLCQYENDETVGTLECQHEYHASCIKEWLLKGKRSCPICRSSVLPS